MPNENTRAPLARATLLGALALLLGACAGGVDGPDGDAGGVAGQVGVSLYGSTRSHNVGEDCKRCHDTGGPGQGVFTVAGTVYSGSSPAPNTTVYLYSDQNYSNRVLTLEVDGRGNFYTVQSVAELVPNGNGLVQGVFVAVKGADGQTRRMSGRISTGSSSCNSCHSPGGTQSRIQ